MGCRICEASAKPKADFLAQRLENLKEGRAATQTLLLTPILGCPHPKCALANMEIDCFNASDSNRL
jgi:hypothetical protein